MLIKKSDIQILLMKKIGKLRKESLAKNLRTIKKKLKKTLTNICQLGIIFQK